MNRLIWASLFIFLSCSHEPTRSIASKSRPTNLVVDTQKSSLHLVESKKILLKVRNDLNEEIEISSTEVKIKNAQGKSVPFQLHRAGSGKYYLFPLGQEEVLEIRIQGKLLGKSVIASSRKPDVAHSGFTVLSDSDDDVVTLQLKLADKNGRPILGDEVPEIILDGEGIIEGLSSLGNGLWSFSLVLPENNTILYLSVRSQDVYLERIFRIQHVEK